MKPNLLFASFLVVVASAQTQQIDPSYNCLDQCSRSTAAENCFVLTEEKNKQVGVVWSDTPLDISQSFSVEASLYFGVNDGTDPDPGADGIAFVLQSQGATMLGTQGGGIGFSGIMPSFAVEFDTYTNPNTTDTAADHVALVEGGKLLNGVYAGPFALTENLEDGLFHRATIGWDSDNTNFSVVLNGNFIVTSPVNLVDILKTDFAYFGFTSSTGASKNRHEVCIESVRGSNFLFPSASPSVAPSSTAQPSVSPSHAPILSPFASDQLLDKTGDFSNFTCLADCSVRNIGNQCFQLTPDDTRQIGVVWSRIPLDITLSFSVEASLYFGINEGSNADPGADGIAFVLQTWGPETLGTTGGGLGFSGIKPSLGVEFDTFTNPNTTDLVDDHVALVEQGNLVDGVIAGPEALSSNLEDGIFHNLKVEWNSSSSTLNVELDDVVVLSPMVDIADILDSGHAYFGFAASTGMSTNRHEVCFDSIIGEVYEFSPASPSTEPSASASPSNVPTTFSSGLPSMGPSATATATPSGIPSMNPSNFSSTNPSDAPSMNPSDLPSATPSSLPSTLLSDVPTMNPSDFPSSKPSVLPSTNHSFLPSMSPPKIPSTHPSQIPSIIPSSLPSVGPSGSPSTYPSRHPSNLLSDISATNPSSGPSTRPSGLASINPSVAPSTNPSDSPSTYPSVIPSMSPSDVPSPDPSYVPSLSIDPSGSPSVQLIDSFGFSCLENCTRIGASKIVVASLYFGINDGTSPDTGADGIAFVLQNEGPDTLGSQGGGLGYSGIKPSLGVEFDTYANPNTPDLDADHVALTEHGELVNGIVSGPFALPINLEDGLFHDMIFQWDSSTLTVSVYLDGSSVFSTKANIVDIVGTRYVYIGFTASTGMSTNRHEVCIESIEGTEYSGPPRSTSYKPSMSTVPSRVPSSSLSPTGKGGNSVFSMMSSSHNQGMMQLQKGTGKGEGKGKGKGSSGPSFAPTSVPGSTIARGPSRTAEPSSAPPMKARGRDVFERLDD